jgi:hypothetical protein
MDAIDASEENKKAKNLNTSFLFRLMRPFSSPISFAVSQCLICPSVLHTQQLGAVERILMVFCIEDFH